MKTIGITMKTIAALLFLGAMVFSCNLYDVYGTLLIRLPGSGSGRAAVSGAFAGTLKYRIDCTGADTVSKEFSSGATASIHLLPGEWAITITVLNAAGEEIGTSEEYPVSITAGKTVIEQIPVMIDTSRNDIKSFAFTGSAGAKGQFEMFSPNQINVSLPFDMDFFNIGYSVLHTGAKVSLSPNDEKLNFLANNSYSFSVEAENGDVQTYTVMLEPPLPSVYSTHWPDDYIWDAYGLAGLEDFQSSAGGIFVEYACQTADTGLYMLVSNTSASTYQDLIYEVGYILNNPKNVHHEDFEFSSENVNKYTCIYRYEKSSIYYKLTIASSGNRIQISIWPYSGAADLSRVSVNAAEFDSILKIIRTTPGDYVITLTQNLIDYPGISLNTDGVNITVRGNTASRRISWKHDESTPLFQVNAGKLTLENITLGRGTGIIDTGALISIEGGTVEVKSGTTLSNKTGTTDIDSGINIVSGAFIMSGGTIENCYNGIEVNGNDVSVSITGGTIRGNTENGVAINGSDHKITMSGNLEISNNGANGIFALGGGHMIDILGNVVIKGNGANGAIGSGFGLFMSTIASTGASTGFNKGLGAIIYGFTGENKNNSGAIEYWWIGDGINRYDDAAATEVYAAKTGADGYSLVPGSQQPAEWNVKAADDLGALLEPGLFSKNVKGSTVILQNDVTMTDDIEIPAGVTLDLNGKTLMIVSRELKVNGAVTVGAGSNLMMAGAYPSTSGGGTITVEKDGKLYHITDGIFSNFTTTGSGAVIFKSGSELFLGGSFPPALCLYIGSSTYGPVFKLEEGYMALSNTGSPILTLHGKATAWEKGEIPTGQTFAVSAGSVLTINKGTEFQVAGALRVDGALQVDGILTNNGTIECNGTMSGGGYLTGNAPYGDGSWPVWWPSNP